MQGLWLSLYAVYFKPRFLSLRVKCIKLYFEGAGFRDIYRLIDVLHTTVMRWIKKLGDHIEEFRKKDGEVESVNAMELDEMWHFVQKKE